MLVTESLGVWQRDNFTIRATAQGEGVRVERNNGQPFEVLTKTQWAQLVTMLKGLEFSHSRTY
jgi:hypothetical protein